MSYGDALGTLFYRLRQNSTLVSDTEGRIKDDIKDDWGFSQGKAKKAVVVEGPRGGPGVSDPPLKAFRYDITVFAPTIAQVNALMLDVMNWLCPDDVTATPSSFSKPGGVFVLSVTPETGPITITDPDTDWPRSTLPVIVRFT